LQVERKRLTRLGPKSIVFVQYVLEACPLEDSVALPGAEESHGVRHHWLKHTSLIVR